MSEAVVIALIGAALTLLLAVLAALQARTVHKVDAVHVLVNSQKEALTLALADAMEETRQARLELQTLHATIGALREQASRQQGGRSAPHP